MSALCNMCEQEPSDPRAEAQYGEPVCLSCAKANHRRYDDCDHKDEHCPWEWSRLVERTLTITFRVPASVPEDYIEYAANGAMVQISEAVGGLDHAGNEETFPTYVVDHKLNEVPAS